MSGKIICPLIKAFVGKASYVAPKLEVHKLEEVILKMHPLKYDVHNFSIDYTLNPVFLKKLLLDIKPMGSNTLKKTEYIKNAMLDEMGYSKSKKFIKILNNNTLGELNAGFMTHENVIYINNTDILNDKELIALIRHELDHFDKYAKTIACEGLDTVQRAYSRRLFLDRKFWNIASQEAKIAGFNSKKYLNAIQKYCNPNGFIYKQNNQWEYFLARHLYCTNPLEISAYNIEKQVRSILGIDTTTCLDAYGKPIKTIIEATKTKPISKKTFNKLYAIRLILRDKAGKAAIESNDIAKMEELLNKPVAQQELPKIFEDIASWIRNGKINLDI